LCSGEKKSYESSARGEWEKRGKRRGARLGIMKMNKFQLGRRHGQISSHANRKLHFYCVCPVYANPKENSPCNDSARTNNEMNKLNASGNIPSLCDRAEIDGIIFNLVRFQASQNHAHSKVDQHFSKWRVKL
jgi:hypothetical protein